MTHIKTFRGLIADGAQDIVSLHTNNGSTGYQIKKFQIMHTEPGELEAEHTVKIYSVDQNITAASPATNTIDFSDQTLLAIAYIKDHDGVNYAGTSMVIFDNRIVNQDIYVTHSDTNAAYSCNYYIELEQVKLDLNENTVATLKDIRNVTAPT